MVVVIDPVNVDSAVLINVRNNLTIQLFVCWHVSVNVKVGIKLLREPYQEESNWR